MKNFLRKGIRTFLLSRENEKISDTLDRHKTNFYKRIHKRRITECEFVDCLRNIGISKGDTVMVHSSWRKFYNYNGTPNEVIKTLIELVGTEGTILMPCFGNDRKNFDVSNSKSYAGVLSEVFRKFPGVQRSECSHFSVCAYGKEAAYYTNEHYKSEFGFDKYSPYYKFSQKENNKVLMLGMGKKPVKLTLIHCIEYVLKDVYPYYNEYLSKTYSANVRNADGVVSIRKMIEGNYAKLYRKNIKRVYGFLGNGDYKHDSIGNIDIVSINARKTFDIILEMSHKGKPMLNPPKVTRDSFQKLKS